MSVVVVHGVVVVVGMMDVEKIYNRRSKGMQSHHIVGDINRSSIDFSLLSLAVSCM